MSRLIFNICGAISLGVLLLVVMHRSAIGLGYGETMECVNAIVVDISNYDFDSIAAQEQIDSSEVAAAEPVEVSEVNSGYIAQTPRVEELGSDTIYLELPLEATPAQSEVANAQSDERDSVASKIIDINEISVVSSAVSYEPQLLRDDSVKGYAPLRERPVIDRAINQNPFIYKGEFIAGVWATHGSIDSSNAQTLLLLNNISANGHYTSIEPYLGYTYLDNRVVGVRFGYTSIGMKLDSATIDLGEANDLTFDIPYINYSQRSFNYGIFHRSYAGLDSKGHFALFADLDLSYNRSSSTFDIESGGELSRVRGESWGVDLDFNPGVAVYIMPNVSGTLSFGLGGINYSSVKQYDLDGEKIGESSDSKLSFKFNILAINIGLNIHLWSYE